MNIEEIGKGLFGRRARLQLLLWIVDRQEGETSFYLTEAANEIGQPMSVVSSELVRLVALQMLRRWDSTGGDRRVYYTRIENPLWRVAEAIKTSITELELSEARDGS